MLCIANRYLSKEKHTEWSKVYDTAALSVTDCDEEINKVNEQIKYSLYILGATVLVDNLQEGIPNATEMLHNADIKLWILTVNKV